MVVGEVSPSSLRSMKEHTMLCLERDRRAGVISGQVAQQAKATVLLSIPPPSPPARAPGVKHIAVAKSAKTLFDI